MGPRFWKIGLHGCTFAGMFIKAVQKRKAGTNENPMYFRLCESNRDAMGKPRQRMIIALGYLEALPRWSDKQELCRCLNDMVLQDQHPLCDNPHIIELAYHYYQKIVDSGKISAIRETESTNRKAVVDIYTVGVMSPAGGKSGEIIQKNSVTKCSYLFFLSRKSVVKWRNV